MRRAALLTVGVLACAPPELAVSAGPGEVAGSTTGAPVAPTGEPDETSTSTGTDETTGREPTTSDVETTTGATTGTAEPPACAPSDVPGGTLRWSLQGAALPGQVTEIAAHLAGDLVLAGATDPGSQHSDVFVQVHDDAGALRWSDTYTGAHGLEDAVLGLAVDAAGFIHVLVREWVRFEVGQDHATTDARLVVLRYAPDGAHVWRWEREREPVPHGESYRPDGNITVVGDTVVVLIVRNDPEPPVLIGLDVAGNVVSEVAAEGLFAGWRGLGPHGAYFLVHYDGGEIGRVGLDGALMWTASAPAYKSEPLGFLGPQGALHIAWHDGPAAWYLRHHEPDGAPGPTVPVDLGEVGRHIDAGAVHCDGTLLLTGGVGAGVVDDRLWLGRYTPAAEPLWVTDPPFGPSTAYHEGRRIVATPDGDVLVLAPGVDLDSPVLWSSWVGRFAGG